MVTGRTDAVQTILRTMAYRRAVWCARLANLVVLPIVAWAVASQAGVGPEQPVWVFLSAWLVGMPLLAAAWILLFRAGLPWPIRNERERETCTVVLRTMLRDIFRGRRP